MTNRNWKVVFSSYEGVEKRAVEFLSREPPAFTRSTSSPSKAPARLRRKTLVDAAAENMEHFGSQ